MYLLKIHVDLCQLNLYILDWNLKEIYNTPLLNRINIDSFTHIALTP